MQPSNPSNTGILHRINELRENAFAEGPGDDECMADLFELVLLYETLLEEAGMLSYKDQMH